MPATTTLQWDRALARGVCVVALAASLMIALTATATAQTGFQARVTAHNPEPMPCANGAFFCGTADIAGNGSAAWSFSLTSLTQQGQCASYTATVTFELADASTLVLDETGTACGPGGSNLSNASAHSFGHPADINGNWTVHSSDGRFTAMTGSGTDTLHAAGAHSAGSYVANP
jgi:hypothetical protein